ncbi:hypothetical protein [Corynebacterium sp.]|uniref:hypothetical protein n=1 Tax=Corynebacterium sp. TaxID=1720 RepID=UPI002A914F06|nr:hypothetical protein [Corynebacterium sp.]MDY5784599.1 hypothetical protein [Corynebacterium sp.]
MSSNNDDTRQFGFEPGSGAQPPRRERPRQYFPDPAHQQRPQYTQAQGAWEQPASGTGYAQGYDQNYGQNYAPSYREPSRGSSSGAAMALGIIAALATIAAVVFMFLWRGAANEANRTPETVTVTQTQQQTITETTTQRRVGNPFDRGNDGEVPAPVLPSELPTAVPTELPPVDGEIGDFVDGILGDLLQGGQ